MCNNVGLAATWQTGAHTFSSSTVATWLFSDPARRSEFAAIEAEELLPNTRNLSRPRPAQLAVDALLKKGKAVAFITLFLEHLAKTSAGKPASKLEQDGVLTATLARLQQATYPDQEATADNQVAPTMGTTHVVLLRSALMKTVVLAVVVNGDNKRMIVQALWNAVKQTAGSMQDYHIKAQTHSEQTELYTSAEAAEAEHLALLLLGVLLPVLHQTAALVDEGLPYAPGILYQVLLGTLMASSRCTVTQRISQLCAAKLARGGESQS